MDHQRIEEMSIPELYSTGRLSTEDEEAFEAHLLECRECREQVAWADDFRASLRTVAVETAQASLATRTGLLVWLARLTHRSLRSRALRLGLAAALIVLAGLPAWLLFEQSRLREELAEARAAAERPVVPVVPVGEATLTPQGPDASAKAELDHLTQDRTRLEGELARERQARESLASRLAGLTRPQTNPAFVSLGVVRGMSDDLEDIEIGTTPEWIYLSLELPAAEHDTYRVSLYDSRDRRVWKGDGLVPTASDTLTVLLYSDLLKPAEPGTSGTPGKYRLRLEGVDDGRAVPAGELSFRVRRQGE